MAIEVGVLSALAANRKQFFDLIAAAERQFNCDIDELEIQAEIDSNYAQRDTLTEAEAHELLMKACRPKRVNSGESPPPASRG